MPRWPPGTAAGKAVEPGNRRSLDALGFAAVPGVALRGLTGWSTTTYLGYLAGPLGGELARFLAAAKLRYVPRVAAGMASQITMRMLIRTGRGLAELTDADIAAFVRRSRPGNAAAGGP